MNASYIQGRITPSWKNQNNLEFQAKNYRARNRVFSQKQSEARKLENINKHKGRDQGKPRRFTTNPFPPQSVLPSTTVVPGSTLENWTMKETPSLPPMGLIVSWRELVTVWRWV